MMTTTGMMTRATAGPAAPRAQLSPSVASSRSLFVAARVRARPSSGLAGAVRGWRGAGPGTAARGARQRSAASFKEAETEAEADDAEDIADAMYDDDDYPGFDEEEDDGDAAPGGFNASSWAMDDGAVSITSDQHRAAAARAGGEGDDARGEAETEERAADGAAFDGAADGGAGGGYGGRNEWGRSVGPSQSNAGWANDDIISDGGQAWFEGDDDWYEPQYKEVSAPPGSVLEKVQRIHLQEPKDFSFKDGEYFDLTGYVKDNTDNQFCAVLEVAERARERKIEQLEALNPVPPGAALPPIQQAIVDLALEIEASGGKTSAYLVMKEAADRTRLRYELQEAAWASDNYCEEYMPELGVSERAARLLHMGKRVEDAMDFEKDLEMHAEDYNKRF